MRAQSRWTVGFLTVAVLAALLTWRLFPDSRGAAANKLVISGTVFEWRENGSRPLAGVDVLVLRDGKLIGTVTSKDDGTFATDQLPDGTPVVVLFRKKGYGEGKVVCARGDGGDGKHTVTLLRDTDAKALWGDDVGKVFGQLDLKITRPK